MRNGLSMVLLMGVLFGLTATGLAAEYKLKNGDVIVGEVSSVNIQGAIIRYTTPPEGKSSITDRIKWQDFSQETIRELLKSPVVRQSRQFPQLPQLLQVLVVPTPEEMEAQLAVAIPENRKVEIVIGEKPSPGREHAGATLKGALFSGAGLILMLMLYGANLYASYEIGVFRNYPGLMVAGIAAVVPFLTPIIWLCLPYRRIVDPTQDEEEEEEVDEEAEQEAAAVEAAMAAASVAAAPSADSKPIPPTKFFKRGEFNINRRFIETKFASFFRAIPNEEDRDLNLVIKSARGEFTGRRILKITNTDLTFNVPKGDEASVDEVIPLNDVLEIQIRHKDATD